MDTVPTDAFSNLFNQRVILDPENHRVKIFDKLFLGSFQGTVSDHEMASVKALMDQSDPRASAIRNRVFQSQGNLLTALGLQLSDVKVNGVSEKDMDAAGESIWGAIHFLDTGDSSYRLDQFEGLRPNALELSGESKSFLAGVAVSVGIVVWLCI